MNGQFYVQFQPSGRGQAQCEPDPNYPHGKAVDGMQKGQPGCTVTLPYPAPECGFYLVACKLCQLTVCITAAGRADDPTTVKVPCKTGSMN